MTWDTYLVRTRATLIREYAVKAQSPHHAQNIVEKSGDRDLNMIDIAEWDEEVDRVWLETPAPQQ